MYLDYYYYCVLKSLYNFISRSLLLEIVLRLRLYCKAVLAPHKAPARGQELEHEILQDMRAKKGLCLKTAEQTNVALRVSGGLGGGSCRGYY